jgi:histone-lysine N-methyltransferase SETMAR
MFKKTENPTACEMQSVIHFWEQFNHPPYSPDLAPSDFHLFLYLKSFLAGRQFHDDSEVKEAVITCFASQAISFYDEWIQKLVQHYDKCLNSGGNYVE